MGKQLLKLTGFPSFLHLLPISNSMSGSLHEVLLAFLLSFTTRRIPIFPSFFCSPSLPLAFLIFCFLLASPVSPHPPFLSLLNPPATYTLFLHHVTIPGHKAMTSLLTITLGNYSHILPVTALVMSCGHQPGIYGRLDSRN